MRYGVLYIALGAVLTIVAVQRGPTFWPWYALLWGGASFGFVGVALLNRPGMLGKSRDGRIAAWAYALALPYFLLAWGLWHLYRLGSGERCCDEVAPGVWVGRLPRRGELPEGVALVVDLTAEFPRSRELPDHVELLCLPVLDGRAPTRADLQRAIERAAARESGVYVHCAFGHGRSAAVAAALLHADAPELTTPALEEQMRRGRPGIRLNAEQRDALQAWVE